MNLHRTLQASLNEKDVENAYRSYIAKTYKNGQFTSPYNCDGYFINNDLKMLCEFKFNSSLKNNKEALIIIAQSIYYIKRFKNDGENIPNVIFIGDKDECFILPVGLILNYLDKNYDWTIPASGAWDKNSELRLDLLNDSNLNFMIFDINDEFKWETIHTYLTRCIKQIKANIGINSSTIIKAFEYWNQNVINDKSLNDNELIDIFFKVLINPQDVYLHPKKDGIMVVCDKDIKVNKKGFHGFFSCYKENHNPVELKELTANKDRLIKNKERRETGSYFTPSLWVAEAQKMLGEHLGVNWRDEYVVWDCSCGTGNLTRDYRFKNLFMSTLEEVDIKMINDAGYNPEGKKFVFDFLNDDLEKIPVELMEIFKSGKKIIFFNNPPYATANNLLFASDDTKNGVASDTMINKQMKTDNIGPSSQQLYAQFMYRIMKIMKQFNLKDSIMATFSPDKFLTGETFKDFRQQLNVTFMDGMFFKASHFADVSDSWGIAFTIFKH
jgi:hypothetical protein